MKEILQYLFDHQTLSKAQAKSILLEISKNIFNEIEVTSFVTVFLMRSITLAELEGFTEALQQLAPKIDLGTDDLVDIVGTGGDGKNTFNISTLASLVVAGTGQKVAKHGNYAASTISGASNVLETLGYRFKETEADLKNDLEKRNFCYLHAPIFHTSLKSIAPMRKNLGLKTFFNMLGPLINPAQPKYTMIGVANLEIARIYQYLLQKKNADFLLVNALDGYDEISLTSDTKMIDKYGEKIYSAEELQFRKTEAELKNDLEKGNFCYLHAPIFHTSLKSIAPMRKNLGLKTFFNMLGPLINPAQPKYTMIGVANLEIARIYQYLLQKKNADFLLVNALDGYDEISLTSDTKMIDKYGEKIYSAEELQFKNIEAESIFGGNSIEEAAEIFKSILEGKGTYEQNAVVLANAAMALKNTEKYGDYENCLMMAKKSLLEGKALNCLNILID